MLVALLWVAIGICLASGLTHLHVWRGSTRGHAHLLFGALCLLLSGLLYFDARCYTASSPGRRLAPRAACTAVRNRLSA